MRTYLKVATALAVAAFFCFASWNRADAGNVGRSQYKVLAPISHGNLTIFPVVAGSTYDTGRFLTLDEGLRSGEVVITEWGNVRGMVRPRHGRRCPPNADCYIPRDRHAQVNSLALINNSDRPLLLLAGEIVTGGKQDRVIGKDRIVPPDSEPLDLNVFCVEPGRWTGATEQFGTVSKLAPMAQPAVRSKAMAEKDQQKVWDAVGASNSAVVAAVPPAARETVEVTGGTSYARVMSSDEVKKQVDSVATPVQKSYESVLPQLRAQRAIGVVVAVNGEVIWADLFASTSLLEKYWPKLVRSYAAEAVTARRARYGTPSVSEAQRFLEDLDGTRQTVESEPGVFRHTEIWGRGFRAFELASLLPKTGFDVHVSKMAE